jgi:teichuronic acid biosynthesis glycosyltransferase TuaC
MKILVVCSGNYKNFEFRKDQAFVYDQAEAVRQYYQDFTYNTFFVTGRGLKGYLVNLPKLKKRIRESNPDIIHAHGGHTGLLCVLQRKVPVIVSFHGSDINFLKGRAISTLSSLCSAGSIFVSENLKRKTRIRNKNSFVIPCGVDFDLFYPVDKTEAQQALGMKAGSKYILFSSWFNYPEKNYPLAREAMKLIPEIPLLELKNRSREEVNLLINGSELLLMTSSSEGSPQIIKEGMACNCPIVSTDVGDVRQVLQMTEGTFICRPEPSDVAEKIHTALNYGRKTHGREKIGHLDNKLIAGKIVDAYRTIAKKRVLSEMLMVLSFNLLNMDLANSPYALAQFLGL